MKSLQSSEVSYSAQYGLQNWKKSKSKQFSKITPRYHKPKQTGYFEEQLYVDVKKAEEIQGVAIFQDFMKALNSIEWDYLSKVSNVFKFKEAQKMGYVF